MRYYRSRSVEKCRGLYFLRQDPAGHWSVVPAMVGRVEFERTFFFLPPGDKPAEFQASAGDSLEDRVFLELAWASSAVQPFEIGARFDLVSLFRNLHSPITKRTYQRFAASSSQRLAILGLKGLVLDGDTGILTRIEQGDPLLQAPGGREILDYIRFYYSNPDPAGVRILGRLAANSTHRELKVAAACALARLHTQAALPYLAEMLESRDITLKTYGVGGLAMFANNIPNGSHHPAPGEWRYRTEETMAHSAMDEGIIAQNEAHYVGFWRDWWKEHQAELATP